ncbi:hypothetical protein ERD78_16630 [Allopusillimonas soli]|uniref:NrtR DNA-binding winged helix domain-containing protein n=1 Tax=Allopusillimonas soli TaxID=659016 RepID=A0A853FCZ8_9BURK|nr:hypothetical protein [Allopusillimonas soli]NYT38704.1 hypothetical protein [Allopusillimonas soli]TEA71596.1 hypothetical protein ERD78_16630 [Allopusillimonas soli]
MSLPKATSFPASVDQVEAELVAVLVAVNQGRPRVLTRAGHHALPAGPFQSSHRSLQAGMRAWVEAQTHHPLGYVEQLYTFADRDRADQAGRRVISVSYLGLTREGDEAAPAHEAGWRDWYFYFPWEDWRSGRPGMLDTAMLPALHDWCNAADGCTRQTRMQRVADTFGHNHAAWNEELVLQRYELLFEAGLVPEAARRPAAHPNSLPFEERGPSFPKEAAWGHDMQHDHRRILATAMARLRAKIRYRPVVFELMPGEFTLLQLQQAFEAVAGRPLHKQNFRRFIEQQALVEETGRMTRGAAGRPAKLFQFRGDILRERAIAGSKLPLAR